MHIKNSVLKSIYVYENRAMKPIEIVPRRGRKSMKENGNG
jgi:hypothetical protein